MSTTNLDIHHKLTITDIENQQNRIKELVQLVYKLQSDINEIEPIYPSITNEIFQYNIMDINQYKSKKKKKEKSKSTTLNGYFYDFYTDDDDNSV